MTKENEQTSSENNQDDKEVREEEQTESPSEEIQSPGEMVNPKEQAAEVEAIDDEPSDELVKEKKEIPKRDPNAPLTVADVKRNQKDSATEEAAAIASNDIQSESLSTPQHSGEKSNWMKAAVAMVAVLAISLVAWFFLEYNSADRVFNDMLNNQLDTQTVQYEFGTQNTTDSSKPGDFQSQATVDVTDTSEPKAYAHLNQTQSFGFLGSTSIETHSKLIDKTLYINFARFEVDSSVTNDESESFKSPYEIVKEDWVRVPLNEASESFGGNYANTNTLAQRTVFGTAGILTGNFSEDQRSTLLDLIEENKVYEITASESETVDYTDTYKYAVQINSQGLKQLYEQASEFYGYEFDEAILEQYVNALQDTTITLWVDKQDRRAVRMEYAASQLTKAEESSEETDPLTLTVKLVNYNEPVTIEAPTEDQIITIEEFQERVGTTPF